MKVAPRRRPMRGAIPLLLAVVLLVPAALAVARPPDIRWEQPPDARADLTPPQPGVQTWPSGYRAGDALPMPPRRGANDGHGPHPRPPHRLHGRRPRCGAH